ncbi:gibberellin 2-beta-dioxygenase 2-like [Arachis ipaensis]|uniref:gibberellin 2-beta-dioxygenase 2-like n=1 Tax=Arachis ipaensis TaxID=130454 RepID=UPI000A2B00B5|nr:gibberellin 2-beta-dioxygenase 2-like [Arachis ipaensis]
MEIPIIDLSMKNRIELSKQVVKACEEFGIFKVVNHNVPREVVVRMEEEGAEFFAKSNSEKQLTKPFGYGCKNIGNNGDVGELEYLLFPTNPLFISESSKSISNHPNKFRYLCPHLILKLGQNLICIIFISMSNFDVQTIIHYIYMKITTLMNCSDAMNNYIEGAKGVACEILKLVVEGLGVQDKFALSKLIKDVESDSLLRINHYPPSMTTDSEMDPCATGNTNNTIGFGEHSDPQILTIMRFNDVAGLQATTHDGIWFTVPPDPHNFFALVGDALQVFTNERFTSVRHRVQITDTLKARTSIMYFGAPPLNCLITPLPEMVKPPQNPSRYKPFTWDDYKKAMYSCRLGDSRLDPFKVHND